jgi:hypothetical protein
MAAVAAPMPLDAPVSSTVLPARSMDRLMARLLAQMCVPSKAEMARCEQMFAL